MMNLSLDGFCNSSRPQRVNEWKCKARQIFGSCQTIGKTVESDSDINSTWYVLNSLQRLGKKDWKNWKSEEESRPSSLQHC